MARLYARGRFPLFMVSRTAREGLTETIAFCSDGSTLARDTLANRWRLIGRTHRNGTLYARALKKAYLAAGWENLEP